MFSVNSSQFNNITTHDLNKLEEGLLTFVNAIIVIFGIAGNTFVLHASVVYNAIKMDKISVAFIRNIAFADICIASFGYGPSLITLITRKWVLGKAICYITGSLQQVPCSSEILLMAVLSAYRFWALKTPAAVRERIPRMHVNILIALLWGIPLCFLLVFILIDLKVFYDPDLFSCTPKELESHMWLNGVASMLLGLVPFIVIIVSNVGIIVLIVYYSKQVGASQMINKNTTITLLYISVVFIVSYTPYFVFIFMDSNAMVIERWFSLVKWYIIALNCLMNPFIYYLTNETFAKYVRVRLLKRVDRVP